MDSQDDPKYTIGGEGHSQATNVSDAAENRALEAFGYENSYRRALKTAATWCMVISLTSPLSAIYITAFYQIIYGGYWGMTWGWIIPSIIFLPQALATAALCSAMPVNGAFYWWTAALAPKSCTRFLSFLAGWTTTFTLATSIASFAYAITSSFTLGITYLAPEWLPTRPQLMGIAFGVLALWAMLASLRLENVRWIYYGTAAIIVVHTFVFIIALPTSHAVQDMPFASAADVFGKYTNYSGWTPGVAVPFTFFASSWVNSAWATPAYVAEATHDARRSAPRAILTSYCTTALLGLIICLIFSFCITDMDALAADVTGFPLLTLILQHWGTGPTAAFILVVMISTCVGGSAVVLAYSFQIAAFARDGGLPFSAYFTKVNTRLNMPVRAQALLCISGCLLLLLSLSAVASTIIYSLAVMAYLLTFSLPNLLVVISGDRWQPGPFNYGRFDKPIFAWAVLTQFYLAIMEAFPSSPDWTAATFNYNWVIVCGIVLLAVGLYFAGLGRRYKGVSWGSADVGDEPTSITAAGTPCTSVVDGGEQSTILTK